MHPLPCWILPCLSQRAKGSCFAHGSGKGFGRLSWVLSSRQLQPACTLAEQAVIKPAWFAGLLGRLLGFWAGSWLRHPALSTHCLFLDTRFRDLCQYAPE